MSPLPALGFLLSAILQVPPPTDEPAPNPASVPLQSAGTLRMVELLRQCTARVDPQKAPYMNDVRVPLIRASVATASNPGEKRRLREVLGYELLLNGETQAGIDELTSLRAEYLAKNPPNAATKLPGIRSLLAIAWMRLGEQENCLANHGPDSCLAPLQGGGIHAFPRGAENALRELTDALHDTPDDLGARWIYNVASMQLGRWPDQVPKELLVPAAAFASDCDFPRFFDVAPRLGLDTVTGAGGAIAEDFDRDGFIDVLCSGFGLSEQLRVFRNNGDGTFTDRTKAAGLEGLFGGFNCLDFDFDNDGFVDVIVPRGAWFRGEGKFPKSLLRNRGDFTFEDVTEQAGMLTFAPCQKACVGDFDGDGWLDLYYGCEYSKDAPISPELWWNQRNGTFQNVATEVGLNPKLFIKGCAAGDYDNDGRIDLYSSVLGAKNHLFRNEPVVAPAGRPNFRFRDVTVEAGIPDFQDNFTTWFFDYDNDGFLDIATCGYTVLNDKAPADVARLYLGMPTTGDRFHLYRNRGNSTFEDVSRAMGVDRSILSMGANFGDIDNDGWLDFYIGTGDPDLRTLMPNKMFRNDGGKRFQDVTSAGGFGHLQKGHGVVFADFDNDGDQDLYHSLGGTYTGDKYQHVLFENPGFPGNHWITIELRGVKSNRYGVGTRVAITVATPAGSRVIHVVGGTGSDFGGNSLQLEIGLGDATAIEKIELFWPASGIRQSIPGNAVGLTLDEKILIEEGDDTVVPVPMKRIDLSPDDAPPTEHHHHH